MRVELIPYLARSAPNRHALRWNNERTGAHGTPNGDRGYRVYSHIGRCSPIIIFFVPKTTAETNRKC